MKPVDQTIFMDDVPPGTAEAAVQAGTPAGDCIRACIASLFEVPIDVVPHVVQYLDHPAGTDKYLWWWALVGWCHAYGARLTVCESEPPGWSLVTGTSPRGHLHVCVARDGEIVHDPHPSRSGIADPTEWWSWAPSPTSSLGRCT